ncbi:Met32p KNAG_0A04030 [Huiozyma naganishii CBS 8797]|uniref:C2H2-type domain-containing protein n=1 Tax=Huiozyma naganishii (strain ATCC MYA-139 / BCRC 22969 / CBS 8797 / KCTC 17520 / NBRC 10181 / NCYC 3082 / Yp74L-3) TaxID=1071383 RepID=J7RTL5_HUIN7|nr:hypothetical protein KNAG_0A04030 [Kazachstania naganishii CBS 8797]CCK68082.1 hypothetical protein KNAG_0A04030 [Kazachstania naganishii CBS 8797]
MAKREGDYYRRITDAILNVSNNGTDPKLRELLNRLGGVVNTKTENIATPVRVQSVDPSLLDSKFKEQNGMLLKLFTDEVGGHTDSLGGYTGPEKEKYAYRGADRLDTQTPYKSIPKSYKPQSSIDRPFVCAKCHMNFLRCSDLRRHEKIHLPVLPNICSQCGKGFARKDALKRHVNTLACKRNKKKIASLVSNESNRTNSHTSSTSNK